MTTKTKRSGPTYKMLKYLNALYAIKRHCEITYGSMVKQSTIYHIVTEVLKND
jgi:hypothetical protein